MLLRKMPLSACNAWTLNIRNHSVLLLWCATYIQSCRSMHGITCCRKYHDIATWSTLERRGHKTCKRWGERGDPQQLGSWGSNVDGKDTHLHLHTPWLRKYDARTFSKEETFWSPISEKWTPFGHFDIMKSFWSFWCVRIWHVILFPWLYGLRPLRG